MDTRTQVCTKCPEKGEQPISNFHRRGFTFQKTCKACRCEYTREGYRDHGKSRIRPIRIVDTANFPALEQRIATLESQLRSIAARFANDVLETDDIYQEMTTAILIKCKPSDTDGYLVQSAKWTAQAFLAKRLTRDLYTEPFDIDLGKPDHDSHGGESDADKVFFKTADTRSLEDDLIQREASTYLYDVIQTLPEKNRKIIAMLSVGMSQRKIARQLQISEQAVSDSLKTIRSQIGAVTSSYGLAS